MRASRYLALKLNTALAVAVVEFLIKWASSIITISHRTGWNSARYFRKPSYDTIKHEAVAVDDEILTDCKAAAQVSLLLDVQTIG